jgi:mannose/cellobiose epimerase-like protein (N-acyl-D-glucosamine 2-epimerase family)
MVYCFVLGTLVGHDDDIELVRGGIAALSGEYRDASNGGWFTSLRPDGTPLDSGKQAYTHAFVLLAASAATALDESVARPLLDEALTVIDKHFWDDDAGVMRESFDADWTEEELYRGANSNMHSVEALLAAADATRDGVLLLRADRIARRFIDGFAREHNWRIPEHYGAQLAVMHDYNRGNPMHHFRPFGSTPGHLLEWSRLCVQLHSSLRAAGFDALWHIAAARALYERAVIDGWAVDGRPGFVYTVDFDGRAVAHTRMHWVIAEAMSAAAALHTQTGDERYALDLQRWWHEATIHFVDPTNGSWHHALNEDNHPQPDVWPGKPDIYHPLQAVLLPGRAPSPALPFQLATE